jgi:hypothetical protein
MQRGRQSSAMSAAARILGLTIADGKLVGGRDDASEESGKLEHLHGEQSWR